MARILFSKIRPSREILKIRDGTPSEAEEILTYIKKLSKRIVARIMFSKIRPSREILKIRDGTPSEAEEILTYIKKLSKRLEILKIRDGTSLELDVPSNVVQKKRVARILFSQIRPSREILKIRDGTPLEAEEILTYIKNLSKRTSLLLYSKLDIPSNVVQKKRVARILFSKIRPSREILEIRDGTALEAEEVLTYIKKLSKRIEILEIRDGTPLEKKRVAQILFSKIRPSREILKIRDGTPLEAEEILTYIKKLSKRIEPSREILEIRDGTPLEMPSREILEIRDGTPLEKKRVAQILFSKIRPSREILKIRDGTPLEAEEILTYIKKALKTDRPSREILKIRDGTPLENKKWHGFYVPSNVVQKKRVARIMFSKIRPSREILKIRDGTPSEAEEILTYIKKLSKRLDVPSNVVQKKRVARILFSQIRPSREILKIRDGTPLEAEEILTYIKNLSKRTSLLLYSKLDIPSNVVQKKRVARIMFSKIRPSREILEIRDGTALEAEEILTYIKKLSKRIEIRDGTPLEKKRVAQILFSKIRPSREILKIRDGTPLEAEEILTYIKKLSKRIEPSREILEIRDGTPLEMPSREILEIRDGTPLEILFSKIRPSREILKIRDGTPLEAEEILTYIKKALKTDRPSREILEIRDGTPLEAEEILTYIKKLSKRIEILEIRDVARILFSKIRPSREILKIRDGTPLEKRVARILFSKIRPSREILEIRDGTPLEMPSREILKIRDGTPLELDVPSNVVQKKRVAQILFSKIRPSREILKIRDGTPLEAEEILTYIKKLSKRISYFYSKLDIPSNVVQKKRVARILFSKIRPSREILKIRDGTPLEAEEILTYIKKLSKRIGLPSREILKIRDGTPLEAEEILTYIKSSRNGSVCYFYSKLDVPSNVVHKKKVARILFSKIRPSREILKIRDGTPMEAEEILTYIKKLSKRIEILKIRDGTPLEWPSREILKIRDGTPLELDVPSNVVHKKRVAQILFSKIRPSREILKIRDGTPLEAEEILTYIKSSQNGSVCCFSSKLDVPSNVVQKKRVAQILFSKIRPSREILKIRDGTPLEVEEILTYIKKLSKRISYFYSKLDIPSNVVQKKRVARILFSKIRPSREILKIRDGTPLEAEEILTYIKKLSKRIGLLLL
ncbi:hypothetical protein OROMI_001750 [Orobanche minor]